MQQKQENKEDKAPYSIAYKGKLVIHDSSRCLKRMRSSKDSCYCREKPLIASASSL